MRGQDRTETGGEHADDLARLAAERHGPADVVRRRPEVAPPEAVPDHHHPRLGHVVFGAKSRPRAGTTPSTEKYSCETCSPDRLGFALAVSVGRHPVTTASSRRGFSLRQRRSFQASPIVGRPAARAKVLPHRDEPIGVAVRKRPQQQGVDHGEDRRVGANPERERRTATMAKVGDFRSTRTA